MTTALAKFLLLPLLFIINSSFAQETANEPLSSFRWLTGSWERLDLKGDKKGFENWMAKSPAELIGKGFTLQNGDTAFVEELKLLFEEDKVFYVANVSHNPAPVYFEITQVSANGFVCENPQHDFPKKIEYVYRENILTVEISGNGKSAFFRFKKGL